MLELNDGNVSARILQVRDIVAIDIYLDIDALIVNLLNLFVPSVPFPRLINVAFLVEEHH